MTNAQNDVAASAKTPRKGLRILCVVLACILLLALILGGGYWWLYTSGHRDWFGSRDNTAQTPDSLLDDHDDDGSRVVYKGETYYLNRNLVSVLCLGVDKGAISKDETYGSNGQADSIFVVALDTATGSLKVLPLSRETMVDVDIYSSDGSYAGIQNTQLCLAYAYGASGEESCQNVQRSVSRLLYGIETNAYLAVDLDGLEVMTDKIGGVQLTALEDVSGEVHIPKGAKSLTPVTIREGEALNLDGTMAQLYIRGRGQDTEGNQRRMQRQKQFLSAFVEKAGGNLKNNITLLPSYYSAIKPHIVSDLTLSRITYLAGVALSTGVPTPEYVSITGEIVLEGEHAAFHPDVSSLYEAVLEMFYTKQPTK